MDKKLIFIYEPNGLGNARRKITNIRHNEIKADSFEYFSIKEYCKSNFLCPDCLILEDDAKFQIQIAEATFKVDELKTIVICDSIESIKNIIENIEEAPKIITLDYKIGSSHSTENLPEIYNKIKERFFSSAVIGYTVYGRNKPDKEFSEMSADTLTNLLRRNGDAVIEKNGMTPAALSSILFDRIQVSALRIENKIVKAENVKLASLLDRAVVNLPETSGFKNIVGKSIPMRIVYNELLKIKNIDNVTVLILGEPGTGKELIAHAIHENSPRGRKSVFPFFAINCAEISKDNNSAISKLFGHKKGSFTDAIENKKGLFESANNGTVFFDEIGTLPIEAQTKLLRFLETGQFTRLGEDDNILCSDVRMICATNANLKTLIEEGKFRHDFYSRITERTIYLPPIRDRIDDLYDLANYFIHDEALLKKKFKNNPIKFELDDSCITALLEYNYHANVRDLRNLMVNAMIEAKFDNNILDGKILIKEHHIKDGAKSADVEITSGKIDSKTESDEEYGEAIEFLNKIQYIVVNHYKTNKRVDQKDISLYFITRTGQVGLKRETFATDYFTPHKAAIAHLIRTHSDLWKETIEKCQFIRTCKSPTRLIK